MLTNDEVLEALPRITPQWLAGFFDGEGCVNSYKAGPMYNIKVSITQSDAAILALVAMRFAGDADGPFMKPSGLSNKPCYRIQFGGRKCIKFLEYIKDHVIVKRRQVESALEIAYLIFKRSASGGTYTQEEFNAREKFAENIKKANSRD